MILVRRQWEVASLLLPLGTVPVRRRSTTALRIRLGRPIARSARRTGRHLPLLAQVAAAAEENIFTDAWPRCHHIQRTRSPLLLVAAAAAAAATAECDCRRNEGVRRPTLARQIRHGEARRGGGPRPRPLARSDAHASLTSTPGRYARGMVHHCSVRWCCCFIQHVIVPTYVYVEISTYVM